MSRIGNAPITVPGKVDVDISKGNMVTVKGPKGTLMQQVNRDLTIKLEDGTITVSRESNHPKLRAAHGLYRSLINNMLEGVSQGYEKRLELIGVGYRANNTGQLLELALGYSHPIYFAVPDEVKLVTEAVKGKSPTIILQSHDKQLLGQVAAKIRAFRKPEPYKGKGIRYVGEEIRRKAGKAGAK